MSSTSNFASFLSAPIPSVDPEDIKRLWPLVASLEGGVGIDTRALVERCSSGANLNAVFTRAMLVRALLQRGLLDKWREGDTLKDKVFAVAATAPLVPQKEGTLDFDGAAFLAALE